MVLRIENAVPKGDADVYIYDVIGDPWEGTDASAFVRDLRALDVARINLHVNSPGGYVNDAIAIYNAILGHPGEVYGYVEGSADSAASFVLQAADHRVIAKNASMFIHGAQGLVMGDEFDAEGLRDELHAYSENIASIYAERAGGSPQDWLDRMHAGNGVRRGTNYRGQEAVDAGLADEVGIATKNRITEGRIAALLTRNATPAPSAPVVDLGEALRAARLEAPAPTLQQLLEQHLREPLTAALKGA